MDDQGRLKPPHKIIGILILVFVVFVALRPVFEAPNQWVCYSTQFGAWTHNAMYCPR